MDILSNLALGFQVAMTWQNLVYAVGGAVLGTLIGVLPGVGPVATIAMLLPLIYGLDATPALVMLAGVYIGAQYSGSITAICGNPMARQGRVGAALGLTSLGSFVASCVGTVVIAALASPLTELAFKFGPPEYFSLMVLGLTGSVVLASGSLIKAIAMIFLGLLLGQINTDVITGTPRFSFGFPQLSDGLEFVVIAIGVFGLGEIIANLGQPEERRGVITEDLSGIWPTKQEIREAWPAVLRGTALGSILGVLPGGGAMFASFASITLEKKSTLAPRMPPSVGALQGLVGSETAKKAAARTGFVPTMTLGIPPNAGMALLVGALMIKGIQPGPQLMTSNPELFWGLIASMWIGSLMLVVVSLPLFGLWIKALTVHYRVVFPTVVTLCCVGCYSINSNSFDVFAAAAFAMLGYIFYKVSCDPAPLMLGIILGPLMEENLRRTLLLSRGDWSTLLSRPISAGLLIAAVLMLAAVVLPTIRNKRKEVFGEP